MATNTSTSSEKTSSHNYNYDYIVIGAGSGGVRSSRIAATHGAKVALIEEYRVGGTCVLRGCIPKKLLWYGSAFGHARHEGLNYGWSVVNDKPDWAKLIDNKDAELDRLNGIYLTNLVKAGVNVINGHASFVDSHTIVVKEKDSGKEVQYTAEKFLISCGSWPHLPKIPGIEHAITSNEVLDIKQLPKSMVIVGGGYISCEFAHIFNGAGVKITVVYRGEQVLRNFDKDLRTSVMEESARVGINILTHTNVKSLEKLEDGKIKVVLDKGDPLETEVVLFATGRMPNIHSLNLDKAGVKVKEGEGGGVIVDEWSKTSVDNIYAVGDIINKIQLTPVAINEGHALADTLFGNNPRKVDYSDVASAVFTNPPCGTVGPTEDEAIKKYGKDALDFYFTKFTPLIHTITKNGQKSMIKLIVHRETDKVIACHMVDEHAAEVVQGIAIAVKAGLTKKQYDATIGIHPTAAEEIVTLRTKRSN